MIENSPRNFNVPKYFEQHAERLLDQGYHPIPVDPQTKACRITGWTRWCDHRPSPKAIRSLVRSKSSHSVGLACGASVVAIDIDVTDPVKAFEVEDLARQYLGETPLRRIGNPPKCVLVYRAAGTIRSSRWKTKDDHLIEVLAHGRQFVAFGIHPVIGKDYTWPAESPLDVHRDDLPEVTADQLQAFRAATEVARAPAPGAAPSATIEVGPATVEVGKTMGAAVIATASGGLTTPGDAKVTLRNETDFRLCKDEAHRFDRCEDLEAWAVEMDRNLWANPLPEDEVLRCARSAWKYKIEGHLFRSGCEPRVIFSRSEWCEFADDPRALWLWGRLRFAHEAKPEYEFAISPKAWAPTLPKPFNRPATLLEVRDRLVKRDRLILVHKGGRYVGDPSKFKFAPGALARAKGTESVPNTTIHPFPLVPGPGQGEFFNDVKADVIEMKKFVRGKIPSSILRVIEHERRRRGLTHADLANQIGVSRPQLTNALCGRFGLGEQPVARLKAILIEGDAA